MLLEIRRRRPPLSKSKNKTTKGTKFTKIEILPLRVLRALRGLNRLRDLRGYRLEREPEPELHRAVLTRGRFLVLQRAFLRAERVVRPVEQVERLRNQIHLHAV